MKRIIQLYINSYKGLSKEAWLLAIVMLINRTGSMVIPFLSMYMSSELNFSKSQVGIVLGCFGLGSVCGSWLGGWLTDKLGNFRVQAVSLILVVPLFLVLPNFKTFEGLALMIFILTLIADTFRPANSVAVARYAKPENLTKAYSLNRMAVNLGFSIGPALGGFLASFSYDWIFYGNAIAAFAAAIVFVYFFRNRIPRNKIKTLNIPEDKEYEKKDRNAYLDPPFIVFNIFCCLFSMAFFQLLSTLPLFYKEDRGMSEGAIGLLLGFSGFVIVLFEMILVHGVERRFTPRQVMIYGTAIAGLSYLMLNAPFGLAWLYLAMFILSTGEMLTLPFTATISASRATFNTQGAYMGFNSLAFAAANIFSPYLGTYVAEHYGYQTLWYGTALVLLFTSMGFSWILKKM
ncbi:MDR family MFS transporter [Sphingobacterium psychroaquaticum]|uniref:Predicted arabinose efflux permease, MFS family n=1 Tax=Sphingobacterium psychroaquaticum TaxID=561061 RepID=A0A1X7IL85_9SPHI|nr:MFS transporter [Sphingobacterium psychroaquaticum]QBQ41440.1 MFS transporter [Sphingobacterium psychroaquaticum]SMG15242.1 Predicted arabinose efflux permease, MFS family [Sphingobacterium psychroaquaticum]